MLEIITSEKFITLIIILVACMYLIVDMVFKTTESLLKLISALLLILVISITVLILRIEKIPIDTFHKNSNSTYKVKNHKGEEN